METHTEEREKLREIQAIFEKAVTNNSINDLKPHCDPDFSYVSFSDRSFSDFDSFSTQWSATRQEMIGSGSFSTKLDPQPALFVDDIAVCYGNSTNNMLDKKGCSFDFTSNWSVIFKRTGGEWKVLRAHNSLNPFSNPMLQHAVKNTIIKYSVIAFTAGAVLCSLLTYLLLI